MKIKLTKREKWMLHYILDFPIIRYMMCNSKGREDGIQKAEYHLKISNGLAMFFLCEGTYRNNDSYRIKAVGLDIHDYLADILTDRMDEVIGYPVDRPMVGHQFDEYGDKFFSVIIQHMAEISEIVKESKKDLVI